MKKILILLSSICLLFNQTSIAFATNINTEIINNDTINSIPTVNSEDSVTYYNLDNKPLVNSEAAIVMEASTGTILYAKNIHNKHFPASITKVLTSLIAIENSSLGETVTHSKKAIFDVDLDSSRIGIDVGEQLTMEQSLYGIMLESANEVSYAVAEHIAGDVDSFAKLMNEKAKSLGALNSNFVNPHGLPNDNHVTTAYDMALIARAAIQNETFRKITNTRVYTIPPTNVQEETRYLANSHRFIKNRNQFEGAIGGKTGYTTKAKYTLVTFAERNGMTLVSVILRCDSITNEYQDTQALLNFGFDNFSLYNISDINGNDESSAFESTLFTKYSPLFSTSNGRLQVGGEGNVVLPKNASFNEVNKEVILIPLTDLTEDINTIGKINYTYNNIFIGSTDITYNFNSDIPLLKGSYIPKPTIVADATNAINEDVKAPTSNKKAIIIGVSVGVVVLLAGLYIIFVEIPYQKRRNTYKQKRAKRKSTSIDF